MNSKAALRQAQCARVLEPSERTRQSDALRARLLSMDVLVQAKAVALFVGVRHEPQTRRIFEALSPRARWFPKVAGAAGLQWAQVDAWDAMRPAPFGLIEPAHAPEATLPPVDVILVPGLAFDRRGGRLGWGKGYYDRALRGASAYRVGVCLAPGLVETVPTEDHDVLMHAVVTPDATLFGENARERVR
ncbi:MAG: 5-formyltetrahydrofolate cyclo-ligase [bacterium]|nr:5-formyltetrahydrofolate cyclo-ligase [bacterium]